MSCKCGNHCRNTAFKSKLNLILMDILWSNRHGNDIPRQQIGAKTCYTTPNIQDNASMKTKRNIRDHLVNIKRNNIRFHVIMCLISILTFHNYSLIYLRNMIQIFIRTMYKLRTTSRKSKLIFVSGNPVLTPFILNQTSMRNIAKPDLKPMISLG